MASRMESSMTDLSTVKSIAGPWPPVPAPTRIVPPGVVLAGVMPASPEASVAGWHGRAWTVAQLLA